METIVPWHIYICCLVNIRSSFSPQGALTTKNINYFLCLWPSLCLAPPPFLVADTQLYTLLCRSAGPSVRYEFCWIPSGYCITAPAQLSATVLPCIRPCWAHYSCPNAQVTFPITAPAHPHAPGIFVYLTLSYNHTFRYNIKFEITENLWNENKT